MNYITACPNCNTQFLLNDELIKAHRGKVQCGNCEHIFNAKNRLTEVTDDIASADEYQESLAETEVVEEVEQAVISKEDVTSDIPSNAVAEPRPEDVIAEEPLNKQTDVDYFISPPSETEQTKPATAQTLTPVETVDVDAIFTKKARQDKAPSKHAFFFNFMSFLLFILLILQCTYFWRSEIARLYPPIKPLLERACVQLKCTIDLSKNLDLIAIGDSDMQEDETYQSVIKFSSSLKNNANYPQAYPSLELTLTDNDDRPVIKKLITPNQYLVSKQKIKHGLDPNETATIKLSFHVDDPSVASYRILLLY